MCAEFARVERVGVLHHNYEKHRVALVERLREQLGLAASCEPAYPPSLAAYLGPNMIGVVVQEGAF